MPTGSARKPVGSQDVFLQQEGAPNYAFLVNIAPGIAIAVDVIDRAGRLLGIVYGENAQLQQSDPADAHANPVNALEVGSFLHIWDPVAGDWNRFREGAAIGQALVDLADRAGRLVGIVYGEADQLQQLTPADALTPNESLEITGFNMVWDSVGADWNRWREGAAIGQGLVDLADRAARLVGIVYGEADQLQQSAPADAHGNPANALEVGSFPHVWDSGASDWNRWLQSATEGVPLVEDTGLNTNPRRYEKDNGFVTLPIARAGAVATAVWDVGVACIHNPSAVPANGRTAGGITTVYTIEFENPEATAETVWLEDGAGLVLSVIYHMAAADTLVIDYVGGKTFGDNDLFVNASIDDIVCQITGTEV